MVSRYYAILWDVVIGLGFAVGFKVVGGYVMKWIYGWFREEDDHVAGASSQKRQNDSVIQTDVPQHIGRTILWYGLALYWIFSAVLQVRPVLVVTNADLIVRIVAPFGNPPPIHSLIHVFASVWAAHAIIYNIGSILLQLAIGLLLWLGRERIVGTVGLLLSIVLAMAVWIFGEGFGGLFAGTDNIVRGIPGAGLLMALASLLLLLPGAVWKRDRAFMVTKIVRSAFWGLAAIWQAPAVMGAASMLAWNVTAVIAFAALAVLEWIPAMHQVLQFMTILWLACCWWIGQHFGLNGGFALSVGSAPLIGIVFVALDHLTHKQGASAS